MSWQRGVYLHCKLQGVQSERVVVIGKLGEEPTMRGDKSLSDMLDPNCKLDMSSMLFEQDWSGQDLSRTGLIDIYPQRVVTKKKLRATVNNSLLRNKEKMMSS